MAIFYTDSGSFNDLKVTGSAIVSASRGIALQLRSSGSTIFSVSGSAGEIFNISDDGSSNNLFTVTSGSIDILNVDNTKKVNISGSLVVTGSITGSLQGTASYAITASYALNAGSGGGGSSTPPTSFIATGSVTASVNVSTNNVFQVISSSIALMTLSSSNSVGLPSTSNTLRVPGVISTDRLVPNSSPGIGNNFNFGDGINNYRWSFLGTSKTPVAFHIIESPHATLLVTGSEVQVRTLRATEGTIVTGSVNITGSLSVITDTTEFQVTSTGTKIGNNPTDLHTVTGSLSVSSSISASIYTFTNSTSNIQSQGNAYINFYPRNFNGFTIYNNNGTAEGTRVGIGNIAGSGIENAAYTSSILVIESTTKGFLPPRMTGLQVEAIASPANGLMVYCNNGNGVTVNSIGWWGYEGSWKKFTVV